MMVAKADLFKDMSIHDQILYTKDPNKMKQLGRQVSGFDKKIWDEWKHTIVLSGNYEKFMQNVELRDFLIATGDAILVEASPYDRIWGIGMSEDDPNARNPMKWKGQNLLGFALMEARDEIQRVCKNYHR